MGLGSVFVKASRRAKSYVRSNAAVKRGLSKAIASGKVSGNSAKLASQHIDMIKHRQRMRIRNRKATRAMRRAHKIQSVRRDIVGRR